MPNCATLTSINLDLCQGSLGGIKKIYLAPWQENAYTVDTSGNTGTITAIATGVTWTEIPLRKNSASMTSEVQVNDQTGNYVQTTLQITMSRMMADKRLAAQAIMLSGFLAIAVDANGQRWALGKDNEMVCSAGTGQTGQQKTDGNYYQMSLQDDSTDFPYPLGADVEIKTS